MDKSKAVCDRDCFHCKFDDCINDRLEIEDYIEFEEIDKNIIDAPNPKKNRKMSQRAIRRKMAYLSEKGDERLAYAKAYYNLNRERYIRYRLENRDRKSAYDRRYFEENRERICEKNKVYGSKNKEHLRERKKQWREKNREKIRAYQHAYYLRRKEKNGQGD